MRVAVHAGDYEGVSLFNVYKAVVQLPIDMVDISPFSRFPNTLVE